MDSQIRKYSALNAQLLSPDFSLDSIREYLGPETKFKILNSVKDAFATALQFCNVAEGDVVLTQVVGARMALDSILALGATPVLIDSEAANWNISAMMLEVAIHHCVMKNGFRPKAIIVKHYMGVPAFMDEVVAVAKRHQIPLIEDCIGSLGASFGGKVCGTFGQYAIFSIASTSLNGPGLGLLVHAVPEFEEFLQRHLDHDGLEYKEPLPGTYSLSHLKRDLAMRKHNYLRYAEAFKGIEGLDFYRNLMPDVAPSFAYAPLLVDDRVYPNMRNAIVAAIVNAGYDECCAFPPTLNAIEQYSNIVFYSSMVSSNICSTGLLLPSNPTLTDGDIDFIVNVVLQCLNIAKR